MPQTTLPPPRSLRLGRHAVQAWLDRLDQRAGEPGRTNVRRSERFSYRPDSLTMSVVQVDGSPASYAVAGRNLSRTGLGVLAGQFVYPRARCKLELVSPHGRRQVVAGRVARCRYLVGSGALHEVGLALDQPVDVEVFVPQARRVRILLVDEAAPVHELIAGLIAGLRAELHSATTTAQAVDLVATGAFDLILVDMERPSFDSLALTRQFREMGYVGPIVGLAVHTGRELRARCAAAGCTGYIPKPVRREDLEGLVASLLGPPLISSLAQDPALAPLIDRYVSALRETASRMSLASEVGDLAGLEGLVRQVRAEAGSYGFEPITKEAAYVHALLVAGESQERVRRALCSLLHLCLKARPATTPPETALPYLG